MIRVGNLKKWSSKLIPFSQVTLHLDIGSVNTRVLVGKKLVFDEATCVLKNLQDGSILAVGRKAKQVHGKNSPRTEVVFPVREGVVADKMALTNYLRAILKQVIKKDGYKFLKVSGKYALPASASPVEKEAMAKVLAEVGLASLKPIGQSEATYRNIVSSKIKSNSICVINIGGQTTELSLFAHDQLVAVKTISWGGQAFTQVIKEYLQSDYQLGVGWSTAEDIKRQVGYLGKEDDDSPDKSLQMAVRGKDLLENTIKTVTIKADSFFSEFLVLAEELTDGVGLFLTQVPAELVAQSLDQGIFLTGGGSQLKGLSHHLQTLLKCEIFVSSSPQIDVVEGLSKIE